MKHNIHENKICFQAKLRLHLETHSNPKDSISQQTKTIGRKERSDKGAAKTSTALRIAGLLVDPEDANIRGTLKCTAPEQDVNAHVATERSHNSAAESLSESAIGRNSETCNAIKVSILEKVQKSLDIPKNHHDSQQPGFRGNSIQQLCEVNVS